MHAKLTIITEQQQREERTCRRVSDAGDWLIIKVKALGEEGGFYIDLLCIYS